MSISLPMPLAYHYPVNSCDIDVFQSALCRSPKLKTTSMKCPVSLDPDHSEKGVTRERIVKPGARFQQGTGRDGCSPSLLPDSGFKQGAGFALTVTPASCGRSSRQDPRVLISCWYYSTLSHATLRTLGQDRHVLGALLEAALLGGSVGPTRAAGILSHAAKRQDG